MVTETRPLPAAIRNQLDRILQSSKFRGSDKQRTFLRFVVDETLADRASQLKGYTIAVAVYGRKEDFDPQVDPIVRVEAGRLRRALEHYYLTAGKDDPVRIEIPKGGYVPTFHSPLLQPPAARAIAARQQSGVLAKGPSIAVMPIVNLAGDEEQDYFTDGLTEELTVELARYQEFQVIASQSTMRFKGREVNSRDVGRNLGVRFILGGSVRNDLRTFKVTIHLLDTSTAEQIWGESYKPDQTASDLIAVQEDIAHNVVGAIADQYGLVTRMLSKESRKKAPANLEAYDAILRFYHYETVLTPQAFKTAMAALEKAIEIDPEYGLAWAMLGHLHADNFALGFCEIEAPLEKALTFAQKAMALAPENQFVQDALTLVYFHRDDKKLFLQHVDQTLSLNPNSPYIVGVAGWHMVLYGEYERGLGLLKKGIQLNPYHPTWFHLAFFVDCYRRGEYENALTEALQFNYPELYLDPVMRAAALAQLDRPKEARNAVDQLLTLEPDFKKSGRRLLSSYLKVDDVVEKIIAGLQKAGVGDID